MGWALRALREGSGVPWHRVINARGTVSTSCQEGGQILQQTMLEEEGIIFDALGRTDLDVYGWEGLDWGSGVLVTFTAAIAARAS